MDLKMDMKMDMKSFYIILFYFILLLSFFGHNSQSQMKNIAIKNEDLEFILVTNHQTPSAF